MIGMLCCGNDIPGALQMPLSSRIFGSELVTVSPGTHWLRATEDAQGFEQLVTAILMMCGGPLSFPPPFTFHQGSFANLSRKCQTSHGRDDDARRVMVG